MASRGEDWPLTVYLIVGAIAGPLCAVAAFLGAWIYCTATYGFLLGFGLGWLPASILAVIVNLVVRFGWPVIVVLILVAIKRG